MTPEELQGIRFYEDMIPMKPNAAAGGAGYQNTVPAQNNYDILQQRMLGLLPQGMGGSRTPPPAAPPAQQPAQNQGFGYRDAQGNRIQSGYQGLAQLYNMGTGQGIGNFRQYDPNTYGRDQSEYTLEQARQYRPR